MISWFPVLTLVVIGCEVYVGCIHIPADWKFEFHMDHVSVKFAVTEVVLCSYCTSGSVSFFAISYGCLYLWRALTML